MEVTLNIYVVVAMAVCAAAGFIFGVTATRRIEKLRVEGTVPLGGLLVELDVDTEKMEAELRATESTTGLDKAYQPKVYRARTKLKRV